MLEQKIIKGNVSLYKENLGIRASFFDFNDKKRKSELIDPSKTNSITLSKGGNISTAIFKLNPNLQITILSDGEPSHIISPVGKSSILLKNFILLDKLPKYKKRRLAYIFAKGVSSMRIKCLSRMNESRKDKTLKENILKMRSYERSLIKCKDRKEIMAYEGNVANVFYQSLNYLNPQFFSKRDRDSTDLSNCAMNYAHAILRNKVRLILSSHQIPLNIGFLHKRENREEDYLVWDFSELYIAYVDQLIFYMINKKIIKESGCINGKLNEETRLKIIDLINKRVSDELISEKVRNLLEFAKGNKRFSWKV